MLPPQIIADIEHGLEKCHAGAWRQLADHELKAQIKSSFVMGWRINLSPEYLSGRPDYLILAIDRAFPNSQPRIIAPNIDNDYRWPHVEETGLLCLPPSRNFASIADRILMHLKDAQELFSCTEDKKRKEFEREFAAYWGRRSTHKAALSLVTPGRKSREIFYFYDKQVPRSCDECRHSRRNISSDKERRGFTSEGEKRLHAFAHTHRIDQ